MLFKRKKKKKETKISLGWFHYALEQANQYDANLIKQVGYSSDYRYVFQKEKWKIDLQKCTITERYECTLSIVSEKEIIPVYQYKGDNIYPTLSSEGQEGMFYLYHSLQSIISQHKQSLSDTLNQHTNYSSFSYKEKTLYQLFEDISLLADYDSPFIEQFSVHSFSLKKDEWEIRIRREGYNDYRLSVKLRISPTLSICICEMKGRDERLHFLANGNWIDGFYSFYNTFSFLLKEAKYRQFYILRYKKEWSLPLEESQIPPVKTETLENLWKLAKRLHESESPYVKAELFDTFHLFHKDFFVQITCWSSNDFTLKVFVEFPKEDRIKIVDMYGKNRAFSFRFEGVWEKYFVSFLSLLEEESDRLTKQKEEKIKNALHS